MFLSYNISEIQSNIATATAKTVNFRTPFTFTASLRVTSQNCAMVSLCQKSKMTRLVGGEKTDIMSSLDIQSMTASDTK